MRIRNVLMFCVVVMSILTMTIAYNKSQKPVSQPNIELEEETILEEEEVVEEEYTISNALNSINAEDLEKHVSWLADDAREGRMTGSKGCQDARDYIVKELESYGYSPSTDSFSVRGRTSENVYACLEGQSKEVIVIGGHYDHVGYSGREVCNGADDNASGVSAILCIAKALSPFIGDEKVKRTIVFQFYSGEEMGLVGSTHYVNNSNSNHIFMMNLDMIGHLTSITTAIQYSDADPLSELVNKMSDRYTFANSVTKYGSRAGASDHVPFSRKNVPCVFLHTGLHKNYHRPTDDYDTLNYNGMEKITCYGLDFLWYVCQNGMISNAAIIEDSKLLNLDHGQTPFIE